MTDESAKLPHYAVIKAPFADDEHAFRMGFQEVAEWEAKRDKSMMATFTHSVGTRSMMLEDVREIVRIGLVGGGMVPAEAIKRIKLYVEQRPVGECLELALSIMEAALFGSPEYQARKNPN